MGATVLTVSFYTLTCILFERKEHIVLSHTSIALWFLAVEIFDQAILEYIGGSSGGDVFHPDGGTHCETNERAIIATLLYISASPSVFTYQSEVVSLPAASLVHCAA